ncbi:MAG: excinuclease ABC subunit UvrC [bacterium]
MQENQGFRKKVALVPDLPGVYLFKDSMGIVIYCGKALSLRKRVASYFRHACEPNPRRRLISALASDLEYIVTNSELEALILESNLIKKYKPRFNILLRDDKNYPHLCITLNEEFPRLKIVRKIKKDGCLYLGPYTPAKAMRKTLSIIHKIFPIRRCRNPLSSTKKRPCLNYQMGLCCAPCAGLISKTHYKDLIQGLILFLQGKREDLIEKLRREMKEAAHAHKFERAAKLRDQIQAIGSCMEKQNVFFSSFENQDCFAVAKNNDRACVQIFFIRYGKVTGRKSLFLFNVEDIHEKELIETVLEQFYSTDIPIPPKILVQLLPDKKILLEEWLTKKRGANVHIHAPQRGKNKELMQMVQKNALLGLSSSLSLAEGPEEYKKLLAQVQQDLQLPHPPRRIEGFDISNLGPTDAVGSMVYWFDTKPIKSKYRKFKIQGIEGIDDYGMMMHVLERRYRRLQKENQEMPDLILIDGGKGHLQAGMKAIAALGLSHIPVISLAKSEELIFQANSDFPLHLPSASPTLKLLQRIRDEAHRFALSYQKTRRMKRAFSSPLDTIPGIGPKRKERLLKHFQGLDMIKKAPLEKLLSTPGLDRKTAEKIYVHFHSKKN